MTDLQVGDELAQRIAAGGRQTLVERLRAAYADAASAHGDVVTVPEERIEVLVQASAEHADALQWRHALATAASRELQIDFAQALAHPAVVHAHALVGAPSYEAGLATLVARPGESAVPDGALADESSVPDPIPGQEELFIEEPVADHELQATVEHHITFDPDEDAVPGHVPAAQDIVVDLKDQQDPDEGFSESSPSQLPSTETTGELRVTACHLGGVANLPVNDDELSLRMSSVGLDILREEQILGRLRWAEMDDIEVPVGRRLLRRDRGRATLTVRTEHGDASFEVPACSNDELYELVYPLLERYLPLSDS